LRERIKAWLGEAGVVRGVVVELGGFRGVVELRATVVKWESAGAIRWGGSAGWETGPESADAVLSGRCDPDVAIVDMEAACGGVNSCWL